MLPTSASDACLRAMMQMHPQGKASCTCIEISCSGGAEDLKKIFCSFASFGTRQHLEELDGPKFSKLCRDCKLLGRMLNTIDIDLIFASSKPKGARKVTASVADCPHPCPSHTRQSEMDPPYSRVAPASPRAC